MVDIPHTAAGGAMLLGVATPSADSCVKDLGHRVQKTSLVLSPKFLCSVPDVAFVGSRSVFRTVAKSIAALMSCGHPSFLVRQGRVPFKLHLHDIHFLD